MANIIAISIIVSIFIVVISVQHVKAIKCYQQSCWRLGRRWYCLYPDDGDELEVGNDCICTELRYAPQLIISRKFREKQEFFLTNPELALKVDKKGYACDRKVCYCNTSRCNTKIHVPKKFEIGYGKGIITNSAYASS